ncbi:glycine cleavage system aminomethyltransferase GcvT [Jannaschia seohaensis]|uniref:aminomethyltransferase n=1 Tax=Jannaschia seohaensis TaxID=475081 RepID=A0A2Y9B950_9RHOB|nr:glycine cleavage system aminomethyltransferase GcvT [Jannaschia seohaensis]PWJ10936.1 aminomethyltransferase [Jannaschia seohaensis]SSA51537.1 aminomethyltransferase [Jannaschia seohaensis]
MTTEPTDPIKLPLDALHAELGGKMVPFAGHSMPVQYAMGVMGEHLHTREKAGLFDVSHMGQMVIRGEGRAEALERLLPIDVVGLKEGRQRYGLLMLPDGGVADDLMVANRGDHLLMVVNGAMKCLDLEIVQAGMPDHDVTLLEDRALLALQGPSAEAVLAGLVPEAAEMRFMDVRTLDWDGTELWVSRSGYTGEDGYEISVPVARAEAFARALLAHEDAAPIGLGARDSLRLEAGMPLYGQDLTAETTPVEAGLGWAIQKVRRTGGAREGGFPGADRVLAELAEGATRKRVGLRPQGRAPMRTGVALYADETGGDPVGEVTSGGFGPSVGAPVAMGYVPADCAVGTVLYGDVRGKRLPVTVADLPFHTPRYKR